MNIEKEQASQTYLSFKLSDEVFAINVLKVISILEMSHITRVPKAPAYLKGVFNLRGSVLPVVDMRIRFGMAENEPTVDTSIIVLSIDLNGEPFQIGILVDAVKEVLELKTGEIEPSPVIGSKYNSSFLEGMWCVDDGFIMLLDIAKIFATDEIIEFKEQIIIE
jgi:purine-binding chemotaxis protein CheW